MPAKTQYHAFALGAPFRNDVTLAGARSKIRLQPRISGLSEEGRSFLSNIFAHGSEESRKCRNGDSMRVTSGVFHEPQGPLSAKDTKLINNALMGIGVCLVVADGQGGIETLGIKDVYMVGAVNEVCRERVADHRAREAAREREEPRTPIGGYDFDDADGRSADATMGWGIR